MHYAKRRFGQHFLIDKMVIDDIVALIGPKIGEHFVEIGPGAGALTVPLLATGVALDVVEIDRDLVGELKKRFHDAETLTIHQAEALSFDFENVVASGQKIRLVGNLPYNISTPVLFRMLEFKDHISDMTFMLQREVVARLAAKPGTKDYGRLSVMTQCQCQVESHFIVPPSSFEPPPQVYSSIVSLRPKPWPGTLADLRWLEKLVAIAFAQRRKILRNTLGTIIPSQELAKHDISESARAEQVSTEQFLQLALSTAKMSETQTPDGLQVAENSSPTA